MFPLKVSLTDIMPGDFIYRYDTTTDTPVLSKLITFQNIDTLNFGTLYLISFYYRDITKRGNLNKKVHKDFARRVITKSWNTKLPEFVIQPNWIKDFEKLSLYNVFQSRLLRGDDLYDHVPNYMNM